MSNFLVLVCGLSKAKQSASYLFPEDWTTLYSLKTGWVTVWKYPRGRSIGVTCMTSHPPFWKVKEMSFIDFLSLIFTKKSLPLFGK